MPEREPFQLQWPRNDGSGPQSDRHDLLADRPQSEAREFEMGPGEGDTDDRHRQDQRGDEVAERKPPARQHQPDDVAEETQRAGADILPPVPL